MLKLKVADLEEAPDYHPASVITKTAPSKFQALPFVRVYLPNKGS